MNGMFSGCSNLETLGVSSFDISKSENVDDMFCNCQKLNDVDKKSFGRTSFKCGECDASKPFLIEYTNECVENCRNSYHLIEEEKICVEKCEETDYKYNIEEENKCVEKCDDTEYIIEEGNKCIKKEPQSENSKEESMSNCCDISNYESSNSPNQHISESDDDKFNDFDSSSISNSKYLKYDLLFIFIFLLQI
jgi:surface protein